MYRRARFGIGYLPQEASIFRGLNVEENIRAVLEIVEPDRKRANSQLDALLEEFQITHLRKRPRSRYPAASGGASRSRARSRAAAYMLLDEPFAGIDPIAVGEIQAAGAPSDASRHRRAHHGPQCPRNARSDRPRLHRPCGQVLTEGHRLRRSSTDPER